MIKKNTHKALLFKLLFVSFLVNAQVTLEKEVKITDLAMYFNGARNQNSTNNSETTPHDYAYGRTLTPHGDCIKTYKQYVFMTWYRGGKTDRHVMLTRYNTETGSMQTIEFPHQHTGFKGKWWIGETHNTIAVGISPINGTVHMVYDMHAYTNGGAFANDYFRYSYSVDNAADLPDNEFTLDKFVKDPLDGDYRHTTMDGKRDAPHYDRFTYPQFFLNDRGELFLTARDGTSHDGAQAFIKYEASNNKWGRFKYLNALGAQSKGESHNWSIYGSIKYVNGKIRTGFQRRLNTGSDKFQYQNGVYYAYSDDPIGASKWKNHKAEDMTFPLVKAGEVLVYEPGDYVATTATSKVHIVSGFDWTVTDNGDVHIISRVKDNENNITKNIHSYKPNGASEFIISTNFRGADNLYTSGKNVYIIGLNSSGRPFVEKTEGGTNQFTKVYEQTSGRTFRKGEVYISNGKLYYYLLENNASTGDTQPTYLQVIDLNIDSKDPTLSNNFTIQSIGETCPNMDNGKLIINAGALFNYTAKLNGVAYNFTKTTTIENLAPGSHDLCIDIEGKDLIRCFTINIDESETLSAKIDLKNEEAKVSVTSGVPPYTVLKNGKEVFKTNHKNFYVPVKDGDAIKLKGKEACQGEMIKTINLLEGIKVYPNPSNRFFEIFIPNDIDKIGVEIYNIQSKLLDSNINPVVKGKLKLDLQHKPNGIYFVKVKLKKPIFVKVIKQ